MDPESLFWNTVNDFLKESLFEIMRNQAFSQFNLVGGTALSLYLGHRKSIDLDLFTDAPYDTVDFELIEKELKNIFDYVSTPATSVIGQGNSYHVESGNGKLKIDIYYSAEKFVHPINLFGVLRLVSVEDIVAMKVDIVQRIGRKKDFWDLHELLPKFTIGEMIALHAARHPYAHDELLIRKNFLNFTSADDDFEPICLRGKYWELIKLDFYYALQKS